VLPTFLRRKCPRAGVGSFLHSPFPSPEIFNTVPVHDDLLRGLLNADLVGFQTSDYVRHFMTCCSRHLSVSSGARSGHTTSITYHGRNVVVKTLSVGLDMGQLRDTLASPETAAKAREIADAYCWGEGKDATLRSRPSPISDGQAERTGRDTLCSIRHQTKTGDEVIPPRGGAQPRGPRVIWPIVTGPAWPPLCYGPNL
jgi:hypothetical protein